MPVELITHWKRKAKVEAQQLPQTDYCHISHAQITSSHVQAVTLRNVICPQHCSGASGLIVSYQGASREVESEGLAEHCQHMTMPKVKAEI